MPQIVVVGSSNTDMVVKMPHLPCPGQTVLGQEFRMIAGGKGANQAVAAARLGADVVFVARLGCDVFGDNAIQQLRNEGIDTRFITRDEGCPSGVALILVDEAGENMIAVAPGANARLSPSDIESANNVISLSSVMILQLEIPVESVSHAARLGQERGLKVILNPAPACAGGLPSQLLQHVDILVPNESETRAILGLSHDIVVDSSLASRLSDLGPEIVIVTLGARGALVVSHEGAWQVSARKVKAVDTTAAGDAFVGALAVAVGSGHDILTAVEFANAAAALSVMQLGAQSSLPTAEQVADFMNTV